jgi:hypothetical protein
MFLIEANKIRRLLHLSYIGHVKASDFRHSQKELDVILSELPAPFHVLADMSHMASMEITCEDEIVRMMELCNQRGLETVIRVIPEPQRDIGMNILSAFHYPRRVRVITCKTLEEALQHAWDAAP